MKRKKEERRNNRDRVEEGKPQTETMGSREPGPGLGGYRGVLGGSAVPYSLTDGGKIPHHKFILVP